MCDFDNIQRREAYKECRKKHSAGFCRRARDFNISTLKNKHDIQVNLPLDKQKRTINTRYLHKI